MSLDGNLRPCYSLCPDCQSQANIQTPWVMHRPSWDNASESGQNILARTHMYWLDIGCIVLWWLMRDPWCLEICLTVTVKKQHALSCSAHLACCRQHVKSQTSTIITIAALVHWYIKHHDDQNAVYTVLAHASALWASCNRTVLLELVAFRLQHWLDAARQERHVSLSWIPQKTMHQ